MSGKLYLCATPIGNLEDITLRVLRTLKEVDLIAAEDTRNSIKLLNHFEIKTPMTSYHEYNKIEKAYTLIEKMQNGMNIALITDAGTPGISDPGEELAAMCYEAGIEVTSLPGPAACITALTLSGLPTRRFAFEAFLPMDKKERKEVLEELVNETRTIILYEAPHKLVRTLRDLRETLGNRRMTLCRELTKKRTPWHRTAYFSQASHNARVTGFLSRESCTLHRLFPWLSYTSGCPCTSAPVLPSDHHHRRLRLLPDPVHEDFPA